MCDGRETRLITGGGVCCGISEPICSSSDFEMLGNAELESGSKRIEKLKFKKSFVLVLLL